MHKPFRSTKDSTNKKLPAAYWIWPLVCLRQMAAIVQSFRQEFLTALLRDAREWTCDLLHSNHVSPPQKKKTIAPPIHKPSWIRPRPHPIQPLEWLREDSRQQDICMRYGGCEGCKLQSWERVTKDSSLCSNQQLLGYQQLLGGQPHSNLQQSQF